MEKDWTGNSKSAFVQLGASSHTEEEREENDFYATDPKAVDDLLKHETFDKNIWECACGQGHLTKKLQEYGYHVYSTDIIKRWDGIDDIKDFLFEWEDYNGDIITNPPYKFVTEFILKALELVGEGHKVAMFLKLQTLEGQDRYNKVFSNYPPKTIYVYTKRIQCAKNGDFQGTSAVCYAWFVWVKGYKGDPVIKWIN